MKRGYAEYEPLSHRQRARGWVGRLGRGPFRTAQLNIAGWSALLAVCLAAGLLTRYAAQWLSGTGWLPWCAAALPLIGVLVVDRRRAKRVQLKHIDVRLARPEDLPALPGIETSGDIAFRAAGMDLVADAEPADPTAYQPAWRAGRLWVACDRTGRPIGFVRVEIVDDLPHVEQVSVLPSHAGRHTGAWLLAVAADWARDVGYPRMTLRTFSEVPWNGPYYQRLGWRVLPDDAGGPQLQALAQREHALGLTRWPRQAMVLDLTGPGATPATDRGSPAAG